MVTRGCARSQPRSLRKLQQSPADDWGALFGALGATGVGTPRPGPAAPAPTPVRVQQQAPAGPLGTYAASKNGSWSDPTTWAPGFLPPAGSSVLIPSGVRVVWAEGVDLQLVTLIINGTLLCGDGPLTITLAVTTVYVSGLGARLQCGSPAAPFQGRLNITLTGGSFSKDDRQSILASANGTVSLHGRAVRSWTRLAPGSPVLQGSTSLVVEGPVAGWQAGDLVGIAPTDWYQDQAEQRRITSVTATPTGGVQLGVDFPLGFNHNAQTYTALHRGNMRAYTLDARAEVALLSRNIIVQGDARSEGTMQGGDLRAEQAGAALQLSNVQLYRMGKLGQVGRYPVHWHNLGATGVNSFATNVSVHDSYQRCFVVHCTDNTALTGNVCYNVRGFAYMLEDGAETNNTLNGNIAILTQRSTGVLTPTELNSPAAFWFLNPNNTFTNNVAAGAYGPGYMWDLGEEVAARVAQRNTCNERIPGWKEPNPAKPRSADVRARDVHRALLSIPLRRFDSNVAHSGGTALWLDGDGGKLPQDQTPLHVLTNTAAYKIRVYADKFDSCAHSNNIFNLRFLNTICANSARGQWFSAGNALYSDWMMMNASILTGAPLLTYPNASDNQALAALTLYGDPFSTQRMHFEGYVDSPRVRILLGNAIGHGSVNGARNVMGTVTTTDAAQAPRLQLDPSRPFFAVRDATGSVSGRRDSLLVPIRGCTNSKRARFWMSDPKGCPRELDPVVADAAAADPSINCTLVSSQVLFSCTGLRMQGLHVNVRSPLFEGSAADLAVANGAGKALRAVPMTRSASSATGFVTVLLPMRRHHRLSSRAFAAASRVLVALGDADIVTDSTRLTLEGLPRRGNVTSDPPVNATTLVASVAAVDACAFPAPFCVFWEATPGGAAFNAHVRVNAGLRPGWSISLDGVAQGVRMAVSSLVVTLSR